MFTSLCCWQNWDLMVRMDVIGFHLKFLCTGIINELMTVNLEWFNPKLCLRNQSSRLLYKSCVLRRPCHWSSYLIFLLSTEPMGVWRCFCPWSFHYNTSQGISWLLNNKFQFSAVQVLRMFAQHVSALPWLMPTKNGIA